MTIQFQDMDIWPNLCLTQLYTYCMEQKAQNHSTSSICSFVRLLLLVWIKSIEYFFSILSCGLCHLFYRTDRNSELFQAMAKNMVIKHLLIGLFKGLIAEWALQKMALHMGLIVTCFNIFRKYVITHGAFPYRILKYKGSANKDSLRFVFTFKEKKKFISQTLSALDKSFLLAILSSFQMFSGFCK